jgi:enoyl-CoA hydratase
MSQESGTVELRVEDHVAWITLRRPAKLNALSVEMLSELEAHVADVDRRQDVRVVVLAAEGERAFSVGADVNAWSALEPLDMWRWWVRDGHRVMQRLASLRQPVIAAIQGMPYRGWRLVAGWNWRWPRTCALRPAAPPSPCRKSRLVRCPGGVALRACPSSWE